MWKSTIVTILCGGSWLLAAPAASGQIMRPFDAGRLPAARPYSTAAYSKLPVSPYVNLGFNANGLSNYQTLVRPLIEEREALGRQSAALERLNQQMRGVRTAGFRHDVEGTAQPARRRSGVRFMYYSHYFGTVR